MDKKPLATIRKFKTEDINKILEIEEQAFPKTAYSKQTFLNYGNSLPDTFILIETGDNIVGYIIFDRGGHIHSTAVKRTYRMKGFGRILFMHAEKYARKRLWVEVRSKNSGAIVFYKKLGMQITGKIPNYYGSDHALIMEMSQKE
ncbi:MAG: GNAT family N-acetyltransferase [Deltaproteobacteria bacterium]|nr:GNAT family N-acetyltransferase [Deltaproteobacteria bacterium]